MKTNKKKLIILSTAMVFTLIGFYNAVVINAESKISSDVKFVKRLDESFGIVTQGRKIATSSEWQKLEKKSPGPATTKKVSIQDPLPMTQEEPTLKAEVLDLKLVEVIKQGVPAEHFIGSLTSINGIVEALEIELPNESLSISYSELSGNVFEYEQNGELCSGMLYQVDEKSYIVTLINGPLEGTRLRFSTSTSADQQEMNTISLSENHHVEVGSFGSQNSEEVSAYSDSQNQVSASGFQTFKF
jgi:hypothetical protein